MPELGSYRDILIYILPLFGMMLAICVVPVGGLAFLIASIFKRRYRATLGVWAGLAFIVLIFGGVILLLYLGDQQCLDAIRRREVSNCGEFMPIVRLALGVCAVIATGIYFPIAWVRSRR